MSVTTEKHGDYNFSDYNSVEYNDDTFYVMMDVETITSTDTDTFSDILAAKLETLTFTDLLLNVFTATRSLTDFMLFVDSLTKSITDKRLTDSIRLQDWISVKKNPAANIWSD